MEHIECGKIMSVYSGKHGCACGCRGKYSYAKMHREVAGRERGYPVYDSDISESNITKSTSCSRKTGTKLKTSAMVFIPTKPKPGFTSCKLSRSNKVADLLNLWEVLPDYGSYMSAVEENTGCDIQPAEFHDLLGDFGNWPATFTPEQIETNIRFIVCEQFGITSYWHQRCGGTNNVLFVGYQGSAPD